LKEISLLLPLNSTGAASWTWGAAFEVGRSMTGGGGILRGGAAGIPAGVGVFMLRTGAGGAPV